MNATFLVFLLCGSPTFVTLDTPEGVSVYGVGEMTPDQRADWMALMDEYVAAGKAKRVDFKVEEQVKGYTCGVST